jgi:hypothetical protein
MSVSNLRQRQEIAQGFARLDAAVAEEKQLPGGYSLERPACARPAELTYT